MYRILKGGEARMRKLDRIGIDKIRKRKYILEARSQKSNLRLPTSNL